jgi:glycosidase
MGPWLDRVEKQVNVPFVRVSDSDGPAIEPTYSAWYDVLTMPQLNQRNPETRAYFLDVARHWLRAFDIDGWRMDVVQFVTPDFWPDFRRAVKETKPDAYLLSEVWGDTSLWLQGDQFDGTMNYSFRDLCLGFFARAEISTARLVEGLIRLYGLYAPQVLHANQNLLSSHDVARFRHLSGERPERVRLATFFQLTMPGVASIYYGDEIGMTGGDDPDNRRAFPWDRPETWDLAQLALTRDLARLRHEYPALRRGDWQPLDPQPGGDVHAFMRTHEEQRILVVLRREGPADPLELPVDGHQATIIYGDIRLGVADGVLRVENLAAWSGAVIAL